MFAWMNVPNGLRHRQPARGGQWYDAYPRRSARHPAARTATRRASRSAANRPLRGHVFTGTLMVGWLLLCLVMHLLLTYAVEPVPVDSCAEYGRKCNYKPTSIECQVLCSQCCMQTCRTPDEAGNCSRVRCSPNSGGGLPKPSDCYARISPPSY